MREKNSEMNQQGTLDDTTTVAIKKFYKKIANEKPSKQDKIMLEDTHGYIDMDWSQYESC